MVRRNIFRFAPFSSRFSHAPCVSLAQLGIAGDTSVGFSEGESNLIYPSIVTFFSDLKANRGRFVADDLQKFTKFEPRIDLDTGPPDHPCTAVIESGFSIAA
jgi:hypothetical protein